MDDISLLHGDCLELLPTISDKVDLVLCDLPYAKTKCKWDTLIPFDLLWAQYERLVGSPTIVLFGVEPFSSMLRLSNQKNYRYDWIWRKSHAANFIASKKMPLIKHENISVFYTKNKTYNPQMVPGEPHFNRSGEELYERSKDSIGGKAPDILQNILVNERFPSSVLEFNGDPMCKRVHPTQKPVALLEYLLRTYTNEGDTILDNCMGSGSTGVACVNTRRKFIGIEKEESYFDIAMNRIAEAVVNTGK